VGHFESLERQARPGRCPAFVRPIAERLEARVFGLVSGALAISEPSRARSERRFSRSRAVPYVHENYMRTWRQMERLVEMGLVRHIGTSNMTIPKLRLLLRDATIKPACNEMELHPHFQQPELFDFVGGAGHGTDRFLPDRLAHPSGSRQDRDGHGGHRRSDHRRYRQTARRPSAVVCVKWAVQRGQVPIPFSVHRNEYLANLQSTVSAALSDEDMRALAESTEIAG